MKGIYVIAIAFLASWTVDATNSNQEQSVQSISKADSQQLGTYTVCPFPQPNEWNTTTNIPHEYDCTKFYKCFLGKGIEQLCPLMIKGDPVTRLHYNRALEVCDWPWQAGCTSCPGRLYPGGQYPPLSKINDKYNNCNYIECINGVAYPRTCPYNTCFSRTCQACVSNRNGGTGCGPTPPPIPTPTPTPIPTPTPTPTPICRNSDTKSHECDCGKYYLCDYANWILYSCSPGLHYGYLQKQCVPPNEANCVIP